MCLVHRADVGKRKEAARDHITQARSGNHVEEFGLNPEGNGELSKYLEEGSGRAGSDSVCKGGWGGRMEFHRGHGDLATFLLGKAGWESLCSDPGTPAYWVWGAKIHTLSVPCTATR